MSDHARLTEELAGVIAEICHSHDLTKLALSGSSLLSQGGLTQQLEARRLSVFAPDERESANHRDLVARLADCGAGVTTVDYAIAETGTLVLSRDERNALLVSLLPRAHPAILRARSKASLGK
jgi:L-lactate utilization protein LutC